MSLGPMLTAIVTPFTADGAVDEPAFVDLLRHLCTTGSDGVVVCGTTGEAPTLSIEEHMQLVELACAERPPGATIVASTGSNDTRHAVEMTERATAAGADAMLSVTPYYNKPNRRGLVELTCDAVLAFLTTTMPTEQGSSYTHSSHSAAVGSSVAASLYSTDHSAAGTHPLGDSAGFGPLDSDATTGGHAGVSDLYHD